MVSLRHWAIVACFSLRQESATFGKVGVQSKSDVNHENLSMFRGRIYLLTKNNSIFDLSTYRFISLLPQSLKLEDMVKKKTRVQGVIWVQIVFVHRCSS